jgi:hypothetical protein
MPVPLRIAFPVMILAALVAWTGAPAEEIDTRSPTDAAADQVAGDGTAAIVQDTVTNAVIGTLQAASAGVVQDKTLVLRISRDFLHDHVPKVADQVTPVSRCLLGARVTGNAITHGEPLVVEGADPSAPSFTIHFRGLTTTHTVASKGPVRVHSTGNSPFDVRRDIHFDANGFSASDTLIDCGFSSSIEGLDVPPGLRGRLLRSLAMPQIERTQPAADAISRQQMGEEVRQAFAEKTDSLVSNLNRRLPWKATLAIVAPNGSERVRQMTSTADYLQIRTSVADSVVPDLPAESADLRAPLELWVLGEPSPVVAAELMALWGLSKMALATPGSSSPTASTAVEAPGNPEASKPEASGLEPELLGEWWVLRLGADFVEQFFDRNGEDTLKATRGAS